MVQVKSVNIGRQLLIADQMKYQGIRNISLPKRHKMSHRRGVARFCYL